MKEQNTLKIGDTVLWRGAFGMDPVKRAVVVAIEETKHSREKEGWEVDEIDWQTVRENRALIILKGEGSDFENWAYGEQVRPCST